MPDAPAQTASRADTAPPGAGASTLESATELDQQVDALLVQLDAATEAVTTTLTNAEGDQVLSLEQQIEKAMTTGGAVTDSGAAAPETPPTTEAAADPGSGPAAQAAAEPPADAQAAMPEAAPPTTPAEPAPSASAAPASDQPKPTEPPAVRASAEALDAKIASGADKALAEADAANDFEDAAAVLAEAPAAPQVVAGAAAAVPAPPAVTAAAPVIAAESVPPAPQAAVPTPAPFPAAPSPAAPAPERIATPPAAGPAAEPPPHTGPSLLTRLRETVVRLLGRAFAPLLRPLAAGLGGLSPATHQTLGWVALITLFNAGVAWAYVLLKGPPDPGIPLGPQPTLHGMSEHPESIKLREQAQKAADEAAAKAAKGAKAGEKSGGH